MKIALVCPASLPATQFGGIVFLAVDLAREFGELGHDVTIYTTDLDFSNGSNKFNKKLPQLEKIENGTENLYKWDYKVGKKFIKVFNLQYEEANEYYNRKGGYRAGSVTAFIDKNTGEVYKPASWKSPAKHVRFDMRIIKEREFLHNPKNVDWAGGHLYMR